MTAAMFLPLLALVGPAALGLLRALPAAETQALLLAAVPVTDKRATWRCSAAWLAGAMR